MKDIYKNLGVQKFMLISNKLSATYWSELRADKETSFCFQFVRIFCATN